MDWAQVAVQWLHVFGGIFWFGGALFSNFVLLPAVRHIPLDACAGSYADDTVWTSSVAVAEASNPILPLAMLELAGFLVVFTAMILMRFGA